MDRKKLKCKDFYIIKIKVYGDFDINTVKGRKHHMERAETWIKLKWNFIEEYSGHDEEYWQWEYMMESDECALEKIEEEIGVSFDKGEGHITIFIPKDKKDIYDWFLENTKSPIKTLKKTNLSHIYFWYKKDMIQKRNHSRNYTLQSMAYKMYSRKKKIKKLNIY